VHASIGRPVPGDNERRINIVYDERHDDQLSGGDRLRGRDVLNHGRSVLLHGLYSGDYNDSSGVNIGGCVHCM
jgi:hypothetical protein